MYWQRRPYEAVGPGAHAFDGASRRWTGARLDGYLAALAPGSSGWRRLPPGDSESLDTETTIAETLILGLRMDRGVPRVEADGPRFRDVFDWAAAAGLTESTPDDRIRLTTRGRLLSNELFARLV